MADRRLRGFERAAATGGVTERAALLREWVRSHRCMGCYCVKQDERIQIHCAACHGNSARDLLSLAAYCGDEAAREVVGWKPGLAGECDCLCSLNDHGSQGCGTWYGDRNTGHGCDCSAKNITTFRVFLFGLSRWPGALVRAAFAAGWVALEVWEHARSFRTTSSEGTAVRVWDLAEESAKPPGVSGCPPELLAPRRALEAGERWLTCPCEEHREAWMWACQRLGGGSPWVLRPQWMEYIDAHTFQPAARLAGEASVRAAIQERLVGWALP